MPKLSEETQRLRRARILDAAETCFSRAGFHRTTMQEICKHAGVSPGAVYLYFKSKEDLIEGLSLRDRAEVRAEFAHVAGQNDIVASLAHMLQNCIVGRPREKTILLMEIGAEATRNPAVARTMSDCDDEIRAQIEAMLSAAIDRRQIAPAMTVPELARLISIVVDGLFWSRATDPTFDCAAMAPHIVALLSAAMRPAGPSPNFEALSTPACAPSADEPRSAPSPRAKARRPA
jgi:AcrR family transcriptional regulator